MRLLIDIGHPAHVHLFKNLAWQMEKKGHTSLFTVREKECSVELLRAYKLPFQITGTHYISIFFKIYGLLRNNYVLYKIAKIFKPDIFLSHGSICAAQISCLFNKPHIALEDTGNMEQIRLYRPFTKVILTPDCLKKNWGKKQINYAGYHELAYLHPSYFQPDSTVLNLLNIKHLENFVLFRFVAWEATHDIGQNGLTLDEKIKIINELSKYVRIFISAEGSLPRALKQYELTIAPEKIHSVLHYATIVVSEGAKMAAEAAILGTVSIYINTQVLPHIDELQNRYELLFHCKSSDPLKEKILFFLNNKHLKQEWQNKRRHLLQDKIDVTKFLLFLIENYPRSIKALKENNSSLLQFK